MEQFLNLSCRRLSALMSESAPIVFVIDDDESVRDAINTLLRSVDLKVELFGSTREFLQRKRPDVPSCLVLDVRLHEEAEIAVLRSRLDSLTPREREVLPLVASGRLNKQIAADLGATEATIKVHRASLMRKMQADSLAELVKMVARLNLPGSNP